MDQSKKFFGEIWILKVKSSLTLASIRVFNWYIFLQLHTVSLYFSELIINQVGATVFALNWQSLHDCVLLY